MNMSKQKTAHRQRVFRRTKRVISLQRIGILCILLVGFGLILILINRGSKTGVVTRVDQQQHDPVLGNPNASVTIIEYGAYSCPSCRAWHKAGFINQILAKYPNKVRFIFRDFPVITPSYDRMAAALAHCALDQGQDRFWAFHNALYEEASASNSQEDLIQLGGQVGLDMSKWEW